VISKESKIRVLIADDHPIFREGLVRIIERCGNMEIVAAVDSGLAAIAAARDDIPDVAVLDVDMPELDGIETAKRLKSEWPDIQIVFLTMHRSRSILRSMRRLQVKGYVLKDAAMNEVVNCIETVMAGRSYLSPSLSDLILGDNSATPATPALALKDLTDSEMKILYRIAESETTRQIADDLGVSVRTVETHRHNICLKLGLTGPHALFKFALVNKGTIESEVLSK
jgi:DNA-binding NarL/FixJ family response regulator